jgi:hypothetical protein
MGGRWLEQVVIAAGVCLIAGGLVGANSGFRGSPTNLIAYALLLVTAVGLLITGCDGGPRPPPRTQVRSDQPNRASTGAAYTSKAAAVTVTTYRFCTCRSACSCKAYAPLR